MRVSAPTECTACRLLEEREELIRLKEEFLANIFHELRTPRHVILGYTEMLLEDDLPGELRDVPVRIRQQSQRLTDLMNLSGLNSGKIGLQISPVPVATILVRLTPLVDQLRRGTDIDVVWECAPFLPAIETDALRLEQVLTNLVANAFKFTAHGRITIAASSTAGGVVFSVTDTGIGIPPEEIPHIFDEFRQVDGSLHAGTVGSASGWHWSKSSRRCCRGRSRSRAVSVKARRSESPFRCNLLSRYACAWWGKRPHAPSQAAFRSAVQCAQRTAFAGIDDKHNGHSLVAAGGGAGAGFGMSRFTCLMSRKMAKATITKSRMVLMNRP